MQIFCTKLNVLSKLTTDKYIYIVETEGGTILIYPNKLANYKIRPEKVINSKVLIAHLKAFWKDGWEFKTSRNFYHNKSFEENIIARYKKLVYE